MAGVGHTYNLYVSILVRDVNDADYRVVPEPIGLKLRQKSGDIYLHAQLFTGFMYVAAALCMLLLRGWKIHQLEVEEARTTSQLGDTQERQYNEKGTGGTPPRITFLGVLGRMVRWRKV